MPPTPRCVVSRFRHKCQGMGLLMPLSRSKSNSSLPKAPGSPACARFCAYRGGGGRASSLRPQAETLSAAEGAAKRQKEATINRPRKHSLAGHSRVTGYDFSRTVSKNKRNNSLLPKAPGSPACAAFSHAGVEVVAPSSLRPQAETLSAAEGAAKRQNRSSSKAHELWLRPASRSHGPPTPHRPRTQNLRHL
jgi:hypothetical protein